MIAPVRGLQRGTSLIEVLITLVVIAFGLLGIGALHMKLQVADIDAYQRAQALVMLEDIASRINTNRFAAASYVTPSATGTNALCNTSTASRAAIDMGQWCNALKGSAEVLGTVRRGAMIGARGCVQDLGDREYLITVAWQGLTPVNPPPEAVTCGAGLYDGGQNPGCTDDRCRRYLTTVVRLADLG